MWLRVIYRFLLTVNIYRAPSMCQTPCWALRMQREKRSSAHGLVWRHRRPYHPLQHRSRSTGAETAQVPSKHRRQPDWETEIRTLCQKGTTLRVYLVQRSASTKILTHEAGTSATKSNIMATGRADFSAKVTINATRKIVMMTEGGTKNNVTYLYTALLLPQFFHVTQFRLTLQKLQWGT